MNCRKRPAARCSGSCSNSGRKSPSVPTATRVSAAPGAVPSGCDRSCCFGVDRHAVLVVGVDGRAVLRGDRGLRHLASLLVHHEAVGPSRPPDAPPHSAPNRSATHGPARWSSVALPSRRTRETNSPSSGPFPLAFENSVVPCWSNTTTSDPRSSALPIAMIDLRVGSWWLARPQSHNRSRAPLRT